MITVRDVLNYIETIAPSSLKMEWDNVGLLCGDPDHKVHQILVALDPFTEVCEEAVRMNADLIVTHHPLIFRPLSAVTEESPVGKALLTLAKNGISAINAHTNLDCAPGGVNDVLAETLGLSDIHPIPSPEAPGGLIRSGLVPEQSLNDFLSFVKNRLSCPGLRYVDGGKSVHKVAVGGGACGSELQEAAENGCDTFVTSDIKYNQFRDAYDLGVNLIDAGHFYTENPVCTVLAGKIQAAFPDISVKISENLSDPMKFFL